MNIVFLIRDLNYGGAQKQLINLVKGLYKQGLNVTVLHFYSGGPLEKELKDCGVPTISLEKRKRWDVFGFFWHLYQQLKHLQPDVVHAYLGESNLAAILLKPFFPRTRIIWGMRCSNLPENHYGWVGQMISELEQLLSPFVDAIIINSHIGKAYCVSKQFADENKMVVIPNGIDTDRFQPDCEAGAKIRAEWGIPKDTILIGLVGRLDPMKDHPNFLKAAKLLLAEQPNLRFVCIGTGPGDYAQKLAQLTDELGLSEHVIWAGARPDMPAINNALDIAVSASAYGEGFSNAIGEAMACGIPCVVTDVGDSAWIVGDQGIVVPPCSPEALKAAIAEMIGQLQTCDRVYIRQRIVTQFSINQLVLNTKQVLLNKDFPSSQQLSNAG